MATTYLITGGAGFIGSHLAEVLLARGDRVIALDDLSTGRLDNLRDALGHPAFRFIEASVCDTRVVGEWAAQAQTVFHLAAAVGVQLIVEHPVHTIVTNVTGTEVVLDAARRHGCRVVLASSSEVYGKGSRVPFGEDDDVLLGPTSRSRWSYAASKMVDEFLGLAYQHEYGVAVTVARLFNTIGPRQTGRYGMVVPRLVRQALTGEPLTVYGDGTQSRCFCDVRDVVQALVGLAAHGDATGAVFNVGSTHEISIDALAQRIRTLADSRSDIVHVPYEAAYSAGFEDMQRRVPDTAKLSQLTGWQPRWSLDETLHAVIAYERGR